MLSNRSNKKNKKNLKHQKKKPKINKKIAKKIAFDSQEKKQITDIIILIF